jgi:hypothetical protein
LSLFESINERTILKLIRTKTFSGGAVTFIMNRKTNKNSKPLTGVWLMAGEVPLLNFCAVTNGSASIKHFVLKIRHYPKPRNVVCHRIWTRRSSLIHPMALPTLTQAAKNPHAQAC